MKLGVVVLVGLGLIAALAAAVLVQMLTVTPPAEVEVLVAARALPAMSVVDGSAVETKKVPHRDVPPGAMSNPVQVVGKVLTVPVLEGEAFNRTNFAKDGSGVHLAAALPAGKRAVSISLMDYTGMVGLLYPGSVVDVMISMQSGRGGARGETITRTLLQGVQVLAVGTEAVTTDDSVKTGETSATRPIRGDQRMVTLLVEPKQAQALQLAMQRGTLSLALRNPLDQQRVSPDVTRLADLAGSELDEPSPTLTERWLEMWVETARRNAQQQRSHEAVAEASADSPSSLFENPTPASDGAAPGARSWETLIIRGRSTEVRSFQMPPEKKPAAVDVEVRS